MVQLGCRNIDNVVVIPSGSYMISSNTLPGYFDKKHLGNIEVFALNDLELFASISVALSINTRFVGTEPKDGFTNSYNKAMKEILPSYGIEVIEIERKTLDDIPNTVISATDVRELLERKNINELSNYVPSTTIKVLRERGYICE